MPLEHTSSVILNDVILQYDLYHDKTNNLKEFLINRFRHRKNFVKPKTKVDALVNVNFHCCEGERIGIIGRNGAGKSTLLKVISGILKPTKGTVKIKGTIQPLIEIGAGFDPEFSGRENIYLNGYMLGFTKAQIKHKEKEIIDFAELHDFIDVPVKYYSSGMAVRLAFTIATSIDPEILVFDEMLSAGDVEFLKKAKIRMQSLLARAKMLIIVSHDLALIQELCTRVIVMHQGQIVFEESAAGAVSYYLNQEYKQMS